MADITVERGGPTLWPWIMGLLFLALLIWALAELVGREADHAPARGVADTVQVEPASP
ncbi:MAG TPA: hypothetical protein VMN39_07760 [Longimicrobiaceae bacterium]|nr:hypothetical protein [Longimicrobiaceae bacterium]